MPKVSKREEEAKSKLIYTKDVEVSRVWCEFSQDADSCQSEDTGQTLDVSTEDGGSGSYIILKTERWAIDAGDEDKFAAMLKEIVNIPTHRGD